jgi:hypothetical protein
MKKNYGNKDKRRRSKGKIEHVLNYLNIMA